MGAAEAAAAAAKAEAAEENVEQTPKSVVVEGAADFVEIKMPLAIAATHILIHKLVGAASYVKSKAFLLKMKLKI